MRVGLAFAMLLSMICATGFCQESASGEAGLHFYGMPFGTITYELSGSTVGEEILYFDQWGMRQARVRHGTSKHYGTLTTITVNLGSEILYMNPTTNLGEKHTDEEIKDIIKNHDPNSSQILAVELLTSRGLQLDRNIKLFGQNCEQWSSKKAQQPLIVLGGVLLEGDKITPDGNIHYQAKKVDFTTPVVESIFLPPPGLRFIDSDINNILISMNKI